jgi:hypothetical protein
MYWPFCCPFAGIAPKEMHAKIASPNLIDKFGLRSVRVAYRLLAVSYQPSRERSIVKSNALPE